LRFDAVRGRTICGLAITKELDGVTYAPDPITPLRLAAKITVSTSPRSRHA